ncbi:hypothetical protein I4U23_025836 [Adineta vaga]|nr:hypothetical protein I4U23_025836 [Adineta vaga]
MRRMSRKDPRVWISLIALVLQNTSLVLVLRYSRTVKTEKYLSSTAIVTAEAIKGLLSVLLVWWENGCSINRFFRVVHDEIYSKPYETSKLAIPSGIYAVQNNLLFIALSYLNAATYQVTYQLKILTTAIFSVYMVGKKLEQHQWFSLVMLAIGVALVTWPTSDETTKRSINQNQVTWFQQSMGFSAVLLSAVTSGFSGVYFEKLLKTSSSSVWVKNIQLAIFGVTFGLIIVFCMDGRAVIDKGFFQGYSNVVWVVIFLQAFGGLIIANVIKYADNIIKGFATSLSIVFSCIISYFFLHDFTPTSFFYMGTMCVLTATFLYGWEKSKPTLAIPDQAHI